ncbi:cytochrome P450 [Exidia glandulosa HHB12029]|uniref:Cytochrome P450 n=1 Tax=Exidia glandulosa HHB12029 TaxID=1314781 RepID=A0A165GLG1_EXIGL|nr:cytochrome P450 [Exidia glandulosa HHB12029]
MDSYFLSVLSGLLSHIVCHRTDPRGRLALLLVLFLAPVLQTVIARPQYVLPFFARAQFIYIVTLCSSTVAYRLSPFHQLSRYPGPLLARISSWWMVWNALDGKQHIRFRKLHEVYGEIVRTGPNHVHVCSAAAIRTVLAFQNQWHRFEGYKTLVPPGGTGAILTVTDPEDHRQRRRVWDRALANTALADYRSMMDARITQLREALDKRCGQEVDISEWLTWFTLDFMGDFAFGGSFDFMARAADPEHLHSTIVRAIGASDLFSKIPWTRAFIHLLPNPMEPLLRVSHELVRKKKALGSDAEVKDLFHHFNQRPSDEELSDDALAQDALIAVVAGSDTSSSVLANAIYYLVSDPFALEKLRAELDQAGDLSDWKGLAKCEYLQAVLNETMRLAPAAPNGVVKESPRSGEVVVAGYILPPKTVVYIPFYPLFRDRRYFSAPDEFRPERWLPGTKDYQHDETAFIPFSYGPTGCAGKQLALLETRAALAMLVQRFDIAFSPGYDPARWEEDIEDRFILSKGSLPVVLNTRQL